MRWLVRAGSGIGGTEKAASLFSIGLVRRGHDVLFLTSAEGPRLKACREAGVQVQVGNDDAPGVGRIISEFRPDIVHQHVPGYPTDNPFYPALRSMPGSRPKVIETNVFGRLEDPESAHFVDYRLFVSSASAVQAYRRARSALDEAALRSATVVYYPVEPILAISAETRRDVREFLEIGEEDLLAVRIGQPSHKWTDWECRAIGAARKSNRNLYLLVMEPPQSLITKIKNHKYGDGIIVKPATSDFGWLSTLYSAADFMIHASDWGESFGYTIAEAMAAGLPIITRTTPWGDNAQVELVDHQTTGLVCNSLPGMSAAIQALVNAPLLRERMSANARSRIRQLANLDTEVRLLENIANGLINGTVPELAHERSRQVLAFAKTFDRREQTVLEVTRGDLRAGYVIGSLYTAYRQGRSFARKIAKLISKVAKGIE